MVRYKPIDSGSHPLYIIACSLSRSNALRNRIDGKVVMYKEHMALVQLMIAQTLFENGDSYKETVS